MARVELPSAFQMPNCRAITLTVQDFHAKRSVCVNELLQISSSQQGGKSMKTPLPQATGERVLADWVTASLRAAIMQGYFEAGEKLDQDLIAEELQVSRTPVREALKVLESEGFVEVRPHRGAFIMSVSRQDIQDIYELRRLLESQAVRQVTPTIPTSVLEELDQSCNQDQELLDAGKDAEHYDCEVFFHASILKYVDNALLVEVLESLSNRTSIVLRFALRQPGPHIPESLQEHRAILRAMRQRDAETAARLMAQHLENSSLRIQELVAASL